MRPIALALASVGVLPAHASTLPFSSYTYSADEDCRWVAESEVDLPGNQWYIGGPEGDREAWLSALHAYRRTVREQAHAMRHIDLNYGGVRAWVRMKDTYARALDLQPGEAFEIQVEARWVEGNPELVLALDYHHRETEAKLGWSTVFSTVTLPQDGGWHRLTWTGSLPEFDAESAWCRPIIGMDATHDAARGRILLRGIAFHVPERAEEALEGLASALPQSPALDLSIYDRRDLRWASRAFVCHFTFMYDLSFFDPETGRYRVDAFLEEGEREFGGYDALVLWQAYPRIGIDERNQFDFYRDMPGGLRGLRRVVKRLHSRGVRVYVDYNPWDVGTRREPVSDNEAIARMVKALGVDGVFLDTMTAGAPELREAVDAARKGVIFEPEGSPPIEQLEICSASWAQWLPQLGAPGILRLKWLEPRHMQHHIARWNDSHAAELASAFLNGSGMLVWENVFGTWNGWSAGDKQTLRRITRIQQLFADHLSSEAWDPMVPTLVEGVYANRWPGEGAALWTVLNVTGDRVREPVLRVPLDEDTRLFDLWNGRELHPRVAGNVAEVSLRLDDLGCLAAVTDDRLLPDIEALCSRQRAEPSLDVEQPSLGTQLQLRPCPTVAPATEPPPGMVLVPAGPVTMDLTHQRRECGCYPDPGTPPERVRDFAWGAPWNGTLEHHIGPVDLPAFYIDEHEVTNAEFARFLEASGYRPKCPTNFIKHWRGRREPPPELRDHPVVYVDLIDARAYATWAGKRLPAESEWHRAAQGDDGREWPWGDEFDGRLCNGSGEGTVAVGSYPEGRSPFGCHDMCGNVWEWTESERSDGHTRFAILRGGSYFRAEGSGWYTPGGAQPNSSHAKFLLMYPGLDRCSTVGFRCVRDLGGGWVQRARKRGSDGISREAAADIRLTPFCCRGALVATRRPWGA